MTDREEEFVNYLETSNDYLLDEKIEEITNWINLFNLIKLVK
jgi:hypothetical protein|tara:strand:+ start:503 stop:628 length:126 start_codon:yes stop_codon:yes gene_type:complete